MLNVQCVYETATRWKRSPEPLEAVGQETFFAP
jgi:hypothetical protein